jgi:hypothetical protein
VRTIKKRGLNDEPSKCLQQGPNPGERLSDCHLNKQRLINLLEAEVHESVGLIEETQTAPPYRISPILRGSQYALRSGVESSLSQGIRRFDLRQSRYLGFARTHLQQGFVRDTCLCPIRHKHPSRTYPQQILTATAMNVVRVIAWLKGDPLGERRWKPGYFARLAPHPPSRQAVIC